MYCLSFILPPHNQFWALSKRKYKTCIFFFSSFYAFFLGTYFPRLLSACSKLLSTRGFTLKINSFEKLFIKWNLRRDNCVTKFKIFHRPTLLNIHLAYSTWISQPRFSSYFDVSKLTLNKYNWDYWGLSFISMKMFKH
jgi:hypothetical protein